MSETREGLLQTYIPWGVLQFEPPERHLLLKVDRTETVHYPEHIATVEVKNVMEKHGVSVEEELVVLDIVIITKCQPLHWIVTESKHSDSGRRVSEHQMLGDVEDLSPNIQVDYVGPPWIWSIFLLLFLLNRSVEVVH